MQKFLRNLFSSVLVSSAFLAISQPQTEVYLMTLRQSSEGPVIENPINISQNEGYDNQPSFWEDGESVLYARTVNGQTDIARYYPGSGNTIIITDTKQGSEYSPTRMPDGRISSIRLDTTGLQLLYAYQLNGKSDVLIPELKIGYHAWLNENQLAAFVLGNPASLQLINTETNDAEIISYDIGRSLHKIPGTNQLSYVDKYEKPWKINTYDLNSGEIEELAPTIEDSEDYCWTPKRQIIMGSGNKLFWWTLGQEWKPFADLSMLGVNKITRVAVSSDGKRLAIVVE